MIASREKSLAEGAIAEFDCKIHSLNERICTATPVMDGAVTAVMNDMFVALVNYRNAAAKLRRMLIDIEGDDE